MGQRVFGGLSAIEVVNQGNAGTKPEDLLLVQWEDWVATVQQAIEELRRSCDRVFVLGQSLGGTLALRVAAHNEIDGVITLAAIAYLKDWRLWFLPVLRPFLQWRQRC